MAELKTRILECRIRPSLTRTWQQCSDSEKPLEAWRSKLLPIFKLGLMRGLIEVYDGYLWLVNNQLYIQPIVESALVIPLEAIAIIGDEFYYIEDGREVYVFDVHEARKYANDLNLLIPPGMNRSGHGLRASRIVPLDSKTFFEEELRPDKVISLVKRDDVNNVTYVETNLDIDTVRLWRPGINLMLLLNPLTESKAYKSPHL